MGTRLVNQCLVAVGLSVVMGSVEARQLGAPLPPALQPASVVSFSVSLQWIANAAGPPATSYQIQAGSGPGRSDLAVVNLPDQTTFAADAPAGTYYVRVIAVNGAGASVASNEIVVTVTGGGCVPPGTPTGLAATDAGGTVTLTWNTAATGGAPTGYLLYVGSTVGVVNIGTFAVGPATTVVSPAPPGQYFVRVAASNACGNSESTLPTIFIVGGGAPSPIGAGLYVGQMFNHALPTGALQAISAVWMDNRGCRRTSIFAGSTAQGPVISIESLPCNDGDLGLRITAVNGNVVDGVCLLGGPSCTFRMIRQ
jgi:hypothetical protein